MTRVEKIALIVLILLIIGTVVFWKKVSAAFSNNKETIVDNEVKKEKKDLKDNDKDSKKKKNKDKDDESFLLTPGSVSSPTRFIA